MDENSVAIIPAAREAVRSHDTNYRYRQNSDFFYLTGFEEPEAIAVIAPVKDKKFTLFVRPRDPEHEIWDGYARASKAPSANTEPTKRFTIGEFDEKLRKFLTARRYFITHSVTRRGNRSENHSPAHAHARRIGNP